MADLISADALSALLRDPRLVLLDVRWRLDAPDGRPAHRAAHLPGAVYVDVVPEGGDVVLRYGAMPVIGADAAAAFAGVLLDARAGERYRGEVEPVDPRAGRVPGAVSAPTAGNLGPDGRFLPPSTLRARFLDAGVRAGAPVAAYCGSGVTAAHEVFALEPAGFAPALWPGSWSQWSADPARPVATGPLPGAE